jgi:putative oxidoreductase
MSKLKACFTLPALSNKASIALLIIRIIAGVAMIQHGWGKMQQPFSWMPLSPIPGFFQFLAAFSEFGGGIAWIIGLVTPLASLGIAITMLVATIFHAIVMGDPMVSMGGGSSYELAIIYFSLSLVLMLVGPGKFSLDTKIFGEKK